VSEADYQPTPIETANISLPDEIRDLTLQLARNLHELRILEHLREKEQIGKEHLEARSESPLLVPFDELPPVEKERYERAASETLKATYALGYRVENSRAQEQFVAAAGLNMRKQPLAQNELAEHMKAMKLEELLTLWQSHSSESWAEMPELYRALGNRILKLGEPLFAYDVLREGLNEWSTDVRLRQLQALALARSGATQRANDILVQLHGEGHSDEETLGVLARTYKDLWAQATDESERKRQLQLAYKFYDEAHERSSGYYSGINAATMALLLGEKERAIGLASEVREACLQELKSLSPESDDRYWPLATLGEAALILGDWDEAEDWYGQAAEVGQTKFGELTSTRRNARLIIDYIGGDKNRIERHFQIPKVAVFSGHMIDRPDRQTARFPAQLERAVRDEIHRRLVKHGAGLGYASAACGSDILFLEALLELNGKAYVVLPYEQEQFKKDSVEIANDPQWVGRFEQVMEKASEVLLASEQPIDESALSFEYTNLLLHGLASIRAERFETDLVPIAVWDGKQGDGPGGTASVVERWRKLGYDIELINLEEMLSQKLPELRSEPEHALSTMQTEEQQAEPTTAAPEFGARMMAMLFADAVHFSKLTEEQIPRFIKYFLGAISEMPAMRNHPPELKNTWGDGLYFVFSDVLDAGEFALELAELMTPASKWVEKGLPEKLNLRIALHAGPVYSCLDPVTGRPNFTGTHVSRAARIEPVTPPGQVYASQEFAALAAAEQVSRFQCEYVGQTPLAKGFGTFPTYHVRRTQPQNEAASSEDAAGKQALPLTKGAESN
jgi:class 3 adenylate cyclase